MVQTVIKAEKKGGGEIATKVKSDIVFCIDVSSSMTPCIQGVKDNINNLIAGIESDPKLSIDWRLGFLGHRSDFPMHQKIQFFIKDFTENSEEFRSAVAGLDVAESEANLPALDWSLDFPWRKDAHKFVLMFTDEPVDGGWNPAASRSKIEELKNKIRDIGASVFIATFYKDPVFADYASIATIDKAAKIEVDGLTSDGFKNAHFDELLKKIGKLLSKGSEGRVSQQKSVEKDIYKVKAIATLTHL
jgi:hypothetical protein